MTEALAYRSFDWPVSTEANTGRGRRPARPDLSIDDVVKTAGIPRPKLYRFFDDKDALFGAVSERVQQMVIERVVPHFDLTDTARPSVVGRHHRGGGDHRGRPRRRRCEPRVLRRCRPRRSGPRCAAMVERACNQRERAGRGVDDVRLGCHVGDRGCAGGRSPSRRASGVAGELINGLTCARIALACNRSGHSATHTAAVNSNARGIPNLRPGLAHRCRHP
ncbi:MAG: TetR family transcriptional regulator [Mycobacterium sp.]|nr:TetR family transcriptional regulator [Mycobacterium sp.]